MEDTTKQKKPSSVAPNSGPNSMVPAAVKQAVAGPSFVNTLVLFLVLSAGAFVVYELGNILLGPPAFGETQTAPGAQLSKASLQGLQNILVLTDVPPTLDFGKQMTGTTSGVQTVTLTAQPGLSAQISVETPSNGDFSVLPASCDLKPSASCALTITFSPKHEQKITSSLKITATPAPPAPGAPGNPGAPPNPATNASAAASSNPTSGSGVITLMGEGTAGCPLTGPAFAEHGWDWFKSKLLMLLVVLIFLVVFLFIRWNMLAVPTRRWAVVATEAVTSRIDSLPDPSTRALEPIRGLLSTASNLLTRPGQRLRDGLRDFLFWSRGQEMAAWANVHEAEEQLVAFLPAANVRASLERAESDLRQAGTPPALALADRIQEALVATPAFPEDKCRPVLEQLQAYLTPLKSDLGDRATRALDPKSPPTVEECQKILQDAATVLASTAATQLAGQIDEASKATQDTIDTLMPLFKQASSFLDPRAAILAAEIRTALAATPTATVGQLKPILSKIADHFQSQAAVLAGKIRTALGAEPAAPIERWRALLYEALGLLYDRTDTNFALMQSWNNKTVFLVGCGLLLIFSLGAGLGNEVLFLMGAAGGLLSRLTRALFRANVPIDYGASWSSLFLSPVVGALMGWGGVLLIILGVRFNVLGSALNVDWCNPTAPIALALAFALGFSERLFTGIFSQIEAKAQASAAATPPSAALTVTTPPTLAPGKVGQKYTQTLAASGGTPPYKWASVSSQLPAGLNLDSNGTISGTPKTAGVASFTVQVTDAASNTKSQPFSISVTQ
jgi:hypothetical protein